MLWDSGAGRVISNGRATMGSSRTRFRHLYSVSHETQKPIYVSSPFENKPHAINHGILSKKWPILNSHPQMWTFSSRKKGWQQKCIFSFFFFLSPLPLKAWPCPSAEAGAKLPTQALAIVQFWNMSDKAAIHQNSVLSLGYTLSGEKRLG